MSDKITPVEHYREIAIDDCQSRDRVDTVVKPAIDEVFAMTSTERLMLYCADVTRPPEARQFAAAKLDAEYQMAAAGRVSRPNVDVGRVHAMVAGLGSRGWRDPRAFGSLLDVPSAPGLPDKVARPPEYREQVEDDRRRRHDEERAERLQSPQRAAAED